MRLTTALLLAVLVTLISESEAFHQRKNVKGRSTPLIDLRALLGKIIQVKIQVLSKVIKPQSSGNSVGGFSLGSLLGSGSAGGSSPLAALGPLLGGLLGGSVGGGSSAQAKSSVNFDDFDDIAPGDSVSDGKGGLSNFGGSSSTSNGDAFGSDDDSF